MSIRFDSRQLDHKSAGHNPQILAGFFHQHLINVWRRTRVVASLRPGIRGDGSAYVQVFYRPNGKQSSTSSEDVASGRKLSSQVVRAAVALPTRSAAAQGPG